MSRTSSHTHHIYLQRPRGQSSILSVLDSGPLATATPSTHPREKHGLKPIEPCSFFPCLYSGSLRVSVYLSVMVIQAELVHGHPFAFACSALISVGSIHIQFLRLILNFHVNY